MQINFLNKDMRNTLEKCHFTLQRWILGSLQHDVRLEEKWFKISYFLRSFIDFYFNFALVCSFIPGVNLHLA